MSIKASDASREHEQALAAIRDTFNKTRPRMNGQDLRRVVLAYLAARGRSDIPVKVRSETDHFNGIQKHCLVLRLPDVSEMTDDERQGIGDIPWKLFDDVCTLVATWFAKHRDRLHVKEWRRLSYFQSPVDVGYDNCHVVMDPWFFHRA